MSGSEKTRKLCPEGHLMDPSWEVCPFCPGDRRERSELARTIVAEAGQEENWMNDHSPSPELARTIRVTDEPTVASAAPGRRTEVMNVPVAMDGMAWLVGTSGGDKGRTHEIAASRITVGADPGCEVSLSHDHVSDRHASIRFADEAFVLTDLDSTNGTYVNDDTVQRETLSDGDRIRFGSSEWVFKCVVFDD